MDSLETLKKLRKKSYKAEKNLHKTINRHKHNFTTTNNRMYYEVTSINTVKITASTRRHITQTINEQGSSKVLILVIREDRE